LIPYSDGIAARRFPVVNVTLIALNFAAFLFYELPNGDAAVNQASFYPCDVTNACHLGIPWGIGWITAMFMHAGWEHILGGWFLYQFFEGNYALVHPDDAGGSGVAFFAHVGGFLFGVLVAIVLKRAGIVAARAAGPPAVQ
jgi:membrane associated rhomboid family serine protease